MQRVVSAKALSTSCDVPKYFEIEKNETYKVLITDFMYGGGDGYSMIKGSKKESLGEFWIEITVISTVGIFDNYKVYFFRWHSVGCCENVHKHENSSPSCRRANTICVIYSQEWIVLLKALFINHHSVTNFSTSGDLSPMYIVFCYFTIKQFVIRKFLVLVSFAFLLIC